MHLRKAIRYWCCDVWFDVRYWCREVIKPLRYRWHDTMCDGILRVHPDLGGSSTSEVDEQRLMWRCTCGALLGESTYRDQRPRVREENAEDV